MQDVSPEALKSMMSQYVDEVFLTSLIIEHPEWDETFYFVNDTKSHTRSGQEYLPAAFKADFTSDEGEGSHEVTLQVVVAGQEVISEVRKVTDPISITMAVFRDADPEIDEFGPHELKTSMAMFSGTRMEFTLARAENPLFDRYPKDAFTPGVAPGIF